MKAIMVALLACVLGPVVALAQAQGNLNTITGVNVTGGRVEIVGTKKPNFTTFTMTDPPRLVVDISEAVFSGVKEELTIGNGTITGIRTASYGTDESAIARVLIGYEREVETDIQATGNSLVVSVAGRGSAALAERPPTVPGAAPAGPAPEAAATAPGVTAEEAAAAAQADRQQQEKAAAQAAAAAQADRQQQEEAAAQAATTGQAEAQRQAQAAAEERRRQQAGEKARREAEAQAAAEERRRQQAEARQARLAQAETPRRAPEQGGRAGTSSRRTTMTLVGFKQEPTSSRVFVRTSEPVRYTVTEGDKEVVLELENTRIAEANNARSMNTSFFDTAVASVDADAGPSRTVRVAIKLKEQVTYQTHQEGNEVSIEFQRPSRR